ncbi:hypothetical protein DAPPUDRAFT_320583 [Daphnia pulex]|uniref:Uncharacterized protein n=1 Tax=Daphnia pulex TaxID=6669 RepID=E9GQI6_DAPPU|nr:hypothetical protein DAPPUDRAFT_320583 [Daphnia pulex]|eukprot:EFX78326.1 hypothetical protein DAPPUDRAFT_320583 [Daphnia pulex]
MGINGQLTKMEELHKTEEIIALNRDQVDADKNFEVKEPVIHKVKVAVSNDQQKAMNCTVCNFTCHFPCDPSRWKESCPAFLKHTLHEKFVDSC